MSDYANIQRLGTSQKSSKAMFSSPQILLCYLLQYRLPLLAITKSQHWLKKLRTLDFSFTVF